MSDEGFSFQLGTAVSLEYDESSMLGVQVDAHGENAAGNARYVIGSYGLIGRPLPADKDGSGAHVLYCDEAKSGFAWVGIDHRDLSKLPKINDGSSGLYNSRGSYILLDYKSKTATIHIVRSSGSHDVTIGTDTGGKDVIELKHSGGATLTLEGSVVTIKNATVKVDASASDYVALSSKVDALFQKQDQFNKTHIHPSGVGPTAPSSTPAETPQSVACTKLLTV